MVDGEVPKVIDYLSALLVHAMAHWKIVALYVLHEEHQSAIFSLVVISLLAFAEHMFIYTWSHASNIILTVHYLTIIAYCINIILRGHRALWLLFTAVICAFHCSLCVVDKKSQPALTGILTAVDILLFSVFFDSIFRC